MGYLSEAIQSDYKASDDDRLSQAFSASFNNSEKFRKLFLKFIGFSSTRQLHSLTQQNFKAGDKDARMDVCIVDVLETGYAPLLETFHSSELQATSRAIFLCTTQWGDCRHRSNPRS